MNFLSLAQIDRMETVKRSAYLTPDLWVPLSEFLTELSSSFV